MNLTWDMDLDVDGEYCHADPGDRHTPPTFAEYVIEQISFRGVDLTAVITEEEKRDMGLMLGEEIEEKKQAEIDAQGDYLYEKHKERRDNQC